MMNDFKFLLMRKKFGMLIPLVLSALLHLVLILCCFPQITAKGEPSLSNWSNILSHQDLFFEEREIIFSKGLDLSLDAIRREYFSPYYSPGSYSSKGEGDHKPSFFIPKVTKAFPPLKDSKDEQNYIYLWERGGIFSSREEEEDISYKAYVSPYGKVLFLYPEKLPINSYGSMHLQEYIREAAFFLDDRFFWTKLEGIVK